MNHLAITSAHPVRSLLALLVAGTALSGLIADSANAQDDGPITVREMKAQLPTVEELLSSDSETFDWIILKSNTLKGDDREVLKVQPIYSKFPRPNTLQLMAEEREKLKSAATRPKPPAGVKPQDFLKQLLEEARYLEVSLPDNPDDTSEEGAASYRLDVTRNVDEIVFHEDRMLARADLLLEAKDLEKAFELLLLLERQVPGWPGYAERRNRLLFEEAMIRQEDGQLEEALAYFEELHELDPSYTRLRTEMGNVIDTLITAAQEINDLRKARYYLLRLRGRDAGHPTAIKWTDQFSSRTENLLKQAQAEHAAGRHKEALALAVKAADVWPPHPLLRSTYGPISERHQVLAIGVTELAGEPTPFFLPTEADRRMKSLLSTDLFQVRRFNRASFYESSLFEEWTPTDLGRQIVFSLRRRRSARETTPLMTSDQIVQAIGERLRLDSPRYDERLATYVRSMTVRSPHEFVLNFSNVPVRPQALFRFPVQEPLPRSASGESAPTTGNKVLSHRFMVQEKDDEHVVLTRAIPQPDRLSSYRVAEVVEKKYSSSEDMIQALLRGDISVIPRPPMWYVEELVQDDRFFVSPFGIPTTHVLQFNPESKPLKNSEFRRALARSLDRQQILSGTVLRDPEAKRGRVVSAPFPRGGSSGSKQSSYAYDRQYDDNLDKGRDLPLAFSLVKFTEKRLGSIPELTMVCEPGEVIRAAAEQLVIQWAKMGITVTLVEADAQTPQDWDIVYRTVRMTEPAADLWPFLTMKPDARVKDLEHLPDWLRQQMIELEQSVDFNTSVEMLQGLHFRLNELVHLIPLWEVDDVMVIRKNIQGFPEGMMHPYQNVEQWKVSAWYSTNLL